MVMMTKSLQQPLLFLQMKENILPDQTSKQDCKYIYMMEAAKQMLKIFSKN